MEQVFRIEIPVEAVDNTDVAALQRLENTLTKLFNSMKSNKDSIDGVFDSIETGAAGAKVAMKKMETAFDGVADGLDDVEDAAGDVSGAYDDAADAAQRAGQQSGSAFDSAKSSADKFCQRIEKSNKTLRDMFKEKLQLTLSAIDRASPVIKDIWNSAKSLVGKGWNMVVRMTDFVTAPFRKIWSLVSSPITMALSMAGIGMSANDVFNTFTGFEVGMSGVRALTEATDSEFLILRETAKSLGASTSFSASEAAQGMQNLASAGFTVSEIVAAMPGMLDLAASSGEDLAIASDIAATTLRGFGIEASNAGHVADVLAEVSARTNAAVSDTGEAMKYIAPIANTMGLSLEEVAASIGILSDAGIKGSQAGTTLRGALSRLAKPSKDMQKVMKKFGLTFYNSNGQMKSISSIIGMLNTKLGRLTEQQRQNALVTLFGQEALSGMMVLMDAGPDKIDSLRYSFEHCEGAASKMSKTRLDNLSGDIEELGGALETLQLDTMEKLNPYLRSAVQWLTSKIPGVQSMLENAIDSGVGKAKELHRNVTRVFDSEKFRNADGLIEKFFIAWDDLIAEPFDKWWSGGGKDKILDKLGKIGEGYGKAINGIVTGVFAALTGKEIDFDGLNISGFARAGLEGSKMFVSSFLGGLNIGELFKKAPGLMQAGLLGFGTIKIGGGIVGVVKTFTALKSALLGTGSAAITAAPAVNAVGKAAVTSSLGIAKAGTVLGGLKTVLASIPIWGWIAAASIAATAIGVKMYADAQERYRQELLHIGDAVAESSAAFEQSAQRYQTAVSAVEGHKEAKLELEATFKPLTEEDYKIITDTIAKIEGEQIEIETILANGGISPVERAILSAQIMALEADKVALSCVLNPPSDEEKAVIQQQIDMLEAEKINIEAILAGAGLSPEDVAALEAQIAGIEMQKAEIEAKIAGGGLSPEDVAALEAQIAALEAEKAEIEARIVGAGLNPDDVAALKQEIDNLETRKILLKASLSLLTPEEIKVLTDKLTEIEAEKVEIEAKIDGGGLPPEEVAALEKQIDELNSQKIVINSVLKSLPDDVVKSYVEQTLGISYEQLIPVLKDTFGINVSLDELQTGSYDSLIESGAIEEAARLNMEAELNRLRGDVDAAKAKAPETLAEISRLESEVEALESSRQTNLTEGGEKTVAAAALEAIIAGWKTDFAAYQRGEISFDEIHSKQSAYEERLYDEVYVAGYVEPEVRATLTDDQLRQGFERMLNTGSSDFSTLLSGMAYMFSTGEGYNFDQADAQAAAIAQKQAEIETARAGLAEVYAGETRLVAADAFAGTDYFGMSVDEIASKYPQIVQELGAAGESMFQNMLAGLHELNTQTDYVAAEQKTQTVDVIDIAAKAQIMQDVQTQVQTIATSYQQMTEDQQASFAASEKGAEQLAAVNEALSTLGLEQIESLDQLNSALETLGGVDLSSFSLAEVQAAFTALGGDANECKLKIDNLRNALEALDGKSTESTHTHTNFTINRTINVAGGRASLNANGGIYDGAMLSWVAEDGPEAIIPLGSKRRNRGIELWLAAGKMLGVSEFADGGIIAPYTGVFEKLNEDSSSDVGSINSSKMNHVGARNNQVSVSVVANPVFHIDGGGSNGDILSQIKAKQSEIAEILGGAIADQLEDIISNMA